MPKQTPPKSSRRPSARPYPEPPRTRSQTSLPTMNHPIQTASAIAPHTHQPGWQQSNPSMHAMPPPLHGYTQRMATPTERMIPTSPTTPVTPAIGRGQGANPSGQWSAQDDKVLLLARAQAHGWSQIQKDNFPSKTSNACRKRYERLVSKRRSSDWDEERRDRVASQYRQMREQTWKPLADAVGENWQDVEKLCLEQGPKNLLAPTGQRDIPRAGSEHGSRVSHDSRDDERVSIHNLINDPSQRHRQSY